MALGVLVVLVSLLFSDLDAMRAERPDDIPA
jgi:hypothetical protein